MPFTTNSQIKIHHLDVGQGDSTLIVIKEGKHPTGSVTPYSITKAILIDGGDSSTMGTRVYNYLFKKLRQPPPLPRKCLDAIICTHYDRDHIAGLSTVINSCLCDKDTKIYDTGNWAGYPSSRKNPTVIAGQFADYLKSIDSKRDALIIEEINRQIEIDPACQRVEADPKYQHKIRLNLRIWNKIKEWKPIQTSSDLPADPEAEKQAKKTAIIDILHIEFTPFDPLDPAVYGPYSAVIMSGIDATAKWVERVTKVIEQNKNENLLIDTDIFNMQPAQADNPKMTCIAANGFVSDNKNLQTLEDKQAGGSSGTEKNQRSLAFLIECDNLLHYYTGGDIGQAQEKRIANYLTNPALNPPKKIDSFKVSHHGSEHSTPAELINNGLQDDSIALISYGNNTYLHPASPILSRLYNTMNTAQTPPHHKIKRLYFTGNMYKSGLDDIPLLQGSNSKPIDIKALEYITDPGTQPAGLDSDRQTRYLCPGTIVLIFSFDQDARHWKMDISHDLFNPSSLPEEFAEGYFIDPLFFIEPIKSGIVSISAAAHTSQFSHQSLEFAKDASNKIYIMLQTTAPQPLIDKKGKFLIENLSIIKPVIDNYYTTVIAPSWRFAPTVATLNAQNLIDEALDALWATRQNMKKLRALFEIPAAKIENSLTYRIAKVVDHVKQYP